MEPTEITASDVLLPTRKARRGVGVLGVVGAISAVVSWPRVPTNQGLWIATAVGCVAGVCLGIASALAPYKDKISPWSVVGGLLGVLGASLISGLVFYERHNHVNGLSLLWVGGWTLVVFAAAFWLLVGPRVARLSAPSTTR